MKKYIRVVVAVELVTVAQTPDQFQPTVYNLIRNLSENVILPIAGIILTFIACYELAPIRVALPEPFAGDRARRPNEPRYILF